MAGLTLLAVVAAVLALLIAVGTWATYGMERSARVRLAKCLEGIETHPIPAPGDVSFTYHTYHGLLTSSTEVRHEVFAPPDQARRLLGRLLRFNLLWTLPTHGSLLYLVSAVMEYAGQRRSLARQESLLAPYHEGWARDLAPDVAVEEVLQRRSETVLLSRIAGWGCYLIVLLCLGALAAALLSWDLGATLGCLAGGLFFFWQGWSFLHPSDEE